MGSCEYYLNCVGKEVVCGVIMNASTVDPAYFPLHHHALANNEYRVAAQYWDGANFVDCSMKHDTGATMLGVPRDVLSSLKDTSLQRAGELDLYGPSNVTKGRRCYHNFRVVIGGMETKTTAIQTREFLLGYPVISRYRNIIDDTAQQKLSMTPLPGKASSDDCNIRLQ